MENVDITESDDYVIEAEDYFIEAEDNDALSCWLNSFEDDKSLVETPSWKSSTFLLEQHARNDNKKAEQDEEKNKNDEIIDSKSNPVNMKLSSNVLTNNVRHNFARMFMNSLNSGDFVNMQNFLNTFMTRSCKVSAAHIIHDPAFKYPPLVIADGPRQYSHYLIGTFVQYPDMTVNMTDCRIVTHRNWLCTKVEMDLEISCTKMCELSVEDWVPAIPSLAEKYEEAMQKDRWPPPTCLPHASAGGEAPVLFSNDSFTLAAAMVSRADSCTLSGALGATTAVTTASGFPLSLGHAPPTTLAHTEETLEAPYLSDLTLSSCDEAEPSLKLRRQRKRSLKPKTPKPPREVGRVSGNPSACTGRKRRPRCDRDLTNVKMEISRSPSLNDILASAECMGPHIPEVYNRSLFRRAAPIVTPLKLQTKGKMVLYLNEHNQLQYVNVEVEQSN